MNVEPVEPDFDDMPDNIHLYPLFGREHVMTTDCWCHPERDPTQPEVVIHNVEH